MKLIFRCTSCGEVLERPRLVCPYCGGLVVAVYERRYGLCYDEAGIWRYCGALPPLPVKLTLGEAGTPLIRSVRLGRGRGVYFKDEGRNPTGSVRDRAASVVVSHAASEGFGGVVAVSDGNMGVSVAAYAARAGLRASIYAPSWIEVEKVFLMKAYGARLFIEDKSIDALLREVDDRVRARGDLYNASSTYNALSLEGLKTLSHEIYMQLGRIPSNVYIPLGSGLTYIALYMGFKELVDAGLASRMPRIVGVEHCGNPKYSEHLGASSGRCREEAYPGLRYSKPPFYNHVIDAIRKSGDVVTVSSRETVRAAKLLAMEEGLLTEISSAVAVAGYMKSGSEDSVVVLFSYGLKSASSYARPLRRKFTEPFVGATKRLVLEIVRSKPGLTGYEIWRELGLNISPQAVYQHLRELAGRGYIRVVEESGVKKYYPPTESSP